MIIVTIFFNIVDCTEKKDDDYLVVKGGQFPLNMPWRKAINLVSLAGP